jgi:hypothetical protein
MFRFGDPGGRIYGSVGAANANVLAYWTARDAGSATLAVSSGAGRTVGSCLRWALVFNSGGASGFLSKALDSRPTWGVAAAYKFAALPSSAMAIVQFLDTASTQVELKLGADANFSVTRAGTLLGTAPSGYSANTWIHVEFKATIHPTAGTIYLAVGGVQRLSLTGQNTRSTSNSSANTIRVGFATDTGNNSGGGNHDLDDVIIYDDQATDANGFADITGPIGDCGLTWLLPGGAGSSAQFTPDSAVANYTRVADTTVDTTSYVESPTVNNLDLYALTDIGTNISSVKSLQIVDYGRKTDAGSRGARAVLRTGGANFTHAGEMALPDSYVYFSNGWGLNPGTGLAWTVADINGLEIGQKVSS